MRTHTLASLLMHCKVCSQKVPTDRFCCPSSQNAQIESLGLVQAVQAKQVGKSSGVKSTNLLTYNHQQTQGRGFAWAALRMKPDAVLVLPADSMFVALHT